MRTLGNELGKPKINNFDSQIGINQNILGFDVSVDNASVVY